MIIFSVVLNMDSITLFLIVFTAVAAIPDGLHNRTPATRYDPTTDVEYHLFTRDNPNVSQPIVLGFPSILAATNYDASRRTIVTVHGWLNSATSEFNVYAVYAFLAAEDVNVIVIDWSAGAADEYFTSLEYSITTAEAIASFVSWLNEASGSTLSQYHLLGHSLGGHMVGIIGRNLGGEVPYITALDPAGPGWTSNTYSFKSDDGIYTEVIHTNAGVYGIPTPVADTDFYPNGGVDMPNCEGDSACDHGQGIYYFAESLIQGGFTAVECDSYLDAMNGTCSGTNTLQMGGISPKTGSTGVYYLQTNTNSPYSMG